MNKVSLTARACLSFIGGSAMSQTIEMTVGSQTYDVDLLENDAAKDWISRLPQKIQFEDYGTTERIAYLNPKLRVGQSPTSMTPHTGDLTYYLPWGNLAVFVRPFRESDGLVPLGRLSEAALQAVARSGDRTVEFRLKE